MESSADAARRSRRVTTGRVAEETAAAAARAARLRPLARAVTTAAERRTKLDGRLVARHARWEQELEARIAALRADHAAKVSADRAGHAAQWGTDAQFHTAVLALLEHASLAEAAAALEVSEHQIRSWRDAALAAAAAGPDPAHARP